MHKKIRHFYSNLPKFSFPCLSEKEMIAEKMAATVTRNRPRDHYDLYQIIKNKIPVDLTLARKKTEQDIRQHK